MTLDRRAVLKAAIAAPAVLTAAAAAASITAALRVFCTSSRAAAPRQFVRRLCLQFMPLGLIGRLVSRLLIDYPDKTLVVSTGGDHSR